MAKKLAFDKLLFTTVVLLVGLGLLMVYSASAALARDRAAGWNPFLFRQSLAAAVGLVAMLAAMHFDYRRLRRPAAVYLLLGGTLALLVGVLFAPELNHTRRWFFVGGLSVQPSELAKLALVVFLAYQIARKAGQVNGREALLPCVVAGGLVALLVLLQPDLGTALLLGATVLLMLFLAGLAWRYLAAGLLLAVPAVALLVVSEPYRLQRLLAFVDPEKDALGSGFQSLQSLIAVGSGGILGLGPGASVQKLYFLPYPHSDFIYAIVAEELGMAGALGVLALFGVLVWRGVRAGLRAPDLFGRHLAWGLTGVLLMQALINVSVALALLPTKGIPLPFLSYGGSSLVVSMTACGVVLNVSQHG
jgi:cell division protein FtsW